MSMEYTLGLTETAVFETHVKLGTECVSVQMVFIVRKILCADCQLDGRTVPSGKDEELFTA